MSLYIKSRPLSGLSLRHVKTSRVIFGQIRHIATHDMTVADLGMLKVNRRRMMDTLHHTCKWGTGTRWGR